MMILLFVMMMKAEPTKIVYDMPLEEFESMMTAPKANLCQPRDYLHVCSKRKFT